MLTCPSGLRYSTIFMLPKHHSFYYSIVKHTKQNYMATYDPIVTYKKISLRNIPHQLRLKRIEKLLKKETKNKTINSYMDFGCASGFITARLKHFLHIPEVYGSDSLQDYINSAVHNYSDINFRLINLNQKNTLSETFDLVTCFETLEHVGNLTTALNTICNAIKPGGLGLLSVPVETGLPGIIKYIAKVNLLGNKEDGLKEIGRENGSRYLKSLWKGENISAYRNIQRDLWWFHYGFDYRSIERHLIEKNIPFQTFTSFTTRFILIEK